MGHLQYPARRSLRIGAGTGSGMGASRTQDGDGLYSTFASEGGHIEYAPKTDVEDELVHVLQARRAGPNACAPEDDQSRVRA
jgi:glucokinase